MYIFLQGTQHDHPKGLAHAYPFYDYNRSLAHAGTQIIMQIDKFKMPRENAKLQKIECFFIFVFRLFQLVHFSSMLSLFIFFLHF